MPVQAVSKEKSEEEMLQKERKREGYREYAIESSTQFLVFAQLPFDSLGRSEEKETQSVEENDTTKMEM